MSDASAIDFILLVFRIAIGAVMFAHGYNHIWGPGTIRGTARWFESIGMRPPLAHAWLASLTELGAGVMLTVGLLTPLASAGVVGVMAVAFVVQHRKNGFFIFRPGEGYEYVMTLLLCGLLLATIGPGGWSLDDALELTDDLTGWTGLLIAAGAGGGGAVALLATCWRRPQPGPEGTMS